jgi:hypothetical protein
MASILAWDSGRAVGTGSIVTQAAMETHSNGARTLRINSPPKLPPTWGNGHGLGDSGADVKATNRRAGPASFRQKSVV